MDEEQQSFEVAMKKLEDITTKMQSKDINLEDSLNYYQQGIELVKFCQKKLEEVEQKIKVLDSENELQDLDKTDET